MARLVLRASKDDGTADWLVSLLEDAPAMVSHLHTLVVEARAPLREPTLQSVRRLAHLQRLHVKVCMETAVPAARRRLVEQAALAGVPGRVSVEWATEGVEP